MKIILLILLFVGVSIMAQGQGKNELSGASISPPKFTEMKATIPASPQSMPGTIENYMARNIEIPQKAVEALTQGTSVVQFVVTEKGTVSDLKIINSISSEIDNEVLRVLKTTDGMWVPGSFNGEPVAVEKEISVVFKNKELGKYTDFLLLGRKYFSKGNEEFFVKNNLDKALKLYDKVMVLLPKDKGLLLVRGMARHEAGDKKGACQDWTRVKNLGGLECDEYLNSLCGYDGYTTMIEILNK